MKKLPPSTLPRVFVAIAGASIATVAVVTVVLLQPPRPADPGPITRELQAAAADLNMAPVADRDVTLLRQAQIIRELAKREKARNDR